MSEIGSNSNLNVKKASQILNDTLPISNTEPQPLIENNATTENDVILQKEEPKSVHLSEKPLTNSSGTHDNQPLVKESIANRRARIEQARREQYRLAQQAALASTGNGTGGSVDDANMDGRSVSAENLDENAADADRLSGKNASPSTYQIAQSSKRINQLLQNGNQNAESLKARIIMRNSARRQLDDDILERFCSTRTANVLDSKTLNDKIKDGWERALEKKLTGNPYELRSLLEEQRNCSKALVDLKSKILSEFEKELDAKDEEYIKELKKQSEEMDTLLDQLQVQFKAVQNAFGQELVEIERAHMIERSQILETNNKEIEAMAEQRRQYELKALEDAHDRHDQSRQQLEHIYSQDAEDYNLVRLKLETDVQVLEQQLQQTRATYQLNIEKLEYNFQVLKKRDEENGSILTSHKRKINRLTDICNNLKLKLEKQQKTFVTDYANIQEELKRIVQQIQDMKTKHRDFNIKDQRNYCDIWKMNEETAKTEMRKLMHADRFVSESILNIPYRAPPQVKLLSYTFDPMLPTAADIDKLGSILNGLNDSRYETSAFEKTNAQGVEAGGTATSTAQESTTDEKDTARSESVDSLALFIQNSTMYNDTIKTFFQYLCDEASFLIEDKLQKLLQPLRPEEQRLMKLDSIFKAMNITTTSQVQSLLKYFIKKPTERSTEPNNNQRVELIHPNEILKAIRRFIGSNGNEDDGGSTVDSSDDEQAAKSEEGDTVSAILDANARSAAFAASEARRAKQEMAKQKRAVREKYWDEIGDVINNDKSKVWNKLAQALEDYNKTLKERSDLANEVEAISLQNAELKHLLRQYMAATVNDELKIPPTQILIAKAGMVSGNSSIKSQSQKPKTAETRSNKTAMRESLPQQGVKQISAPLPLPKVSTITN